MNFLQTVSICKQEKKLWELIKWSPEELWGAAKRVELARSHSLIRESVNNCVTALWWTPEGWRARGRPKTTWRRTVEKEWNKAGWKSWEVAKVWLHRTESVCQTAWRPYAPTGAMRHDNDKKGKCFHWSFLSSLDKFFKEMFMEISLKDFLCLYAGAKRIIIWL